MIEKIVHEEIEKGIFPEIRNEIPIQNYDVIFVGYPIWYFTLPQVMFTFFRKYDFSNKIIVPFNTHEGSHDSGTWTKIKELEPKAVVLDGLAVRGFGVDKISNQVVENWLRYCLDDSTLAKYIQFGTNVFGIDNSLSAVEIANKSIDYVRKIFV